MLNGLMYGLHTSVLAPEESYYLMGRCCTRGGLYRLIVPHPRLQLKPLIYGCRKRQKPAWLLIPTSPAPVDLGAPVMPVIKEKQRQALMLLPGAGAMGSARQLSCKTKLKLDSIPRQTQAEARYP